VSAITIDNRGHDTTVIAFSGMAPLNHLYEWTTAFADIPANFIGVRDPWECWYRRSSFRIMREIWRRASRPWVFIGGSAGGFAALWLGREMRADRIVAFCPQSACGAAKRDLGDHRWSKLCLETPSLDIAWAYPQAIVHYAMDEPLDVMHANRIEAEKREWSAGGHDLPYQLKAHGILHDILLEAMP